LGLAFRIEVDGGVTRETVSRIVQAGAELLVAGNAIFGAGRPEEDARSAAGRWPARPRASERTAFSVELSLSISPGFASKSKKGKHFWSRTTS
jgi:hypothetical protein